MVFQAEVYAINACSDENIDRDYKNKNIYILLDNQIVTKAAETAIHPLWNWLNIRVQLVGAG